MLCVIINAMHIPSAWFIGGVSDTKSNVRFFLFLDKQPGRIDVLKDAYETP